MSAHRKQLGATTAISKVRPDPDATTPGAHMTRRSTGVVLALLASMALVALATTPTHATAGRRVVVRVRPNPLPSPVGQAPPVELQVTPVVGADGGSPAAATTTVPPSPEAAPPSPPPAVTTTCADALAYLVAHQAPGFTDVCAPGSALGHLGYTCFNHAGICDGAKTIHIACPAPFVYMNEAHNSWVGVGLATGIDPYGAGTAAEEAYCYNDRHG
jgi:hypothetical protein